MIRKSKNNEDKPDFEKSVTHWDAERALLSAASQLVGNVGFSIILTVF